MYQAVCDEWNERLKPITGTTPDGQSRMRLVWGPSVTTVFEGKVRPKYAKSGGKERIDGVHWKCLVTSDVGVSKRAEDAPHTAIITGVIVVEPEPIADDRYYIEWWVSPAQVAASPGTMSDTDGETAWNELEDELGPFPRQGLWVCLHRWAHPEDGSFIPPDERLLDYARRAMDDIKRAGTLNSWRDADKGYLAERRNAREADDAANEEAEREEFMHAFKDKWVYGSRLALPVGLGE